MCKRFELCRTGFQKLDKTKDVSKQSKQLEELTAKMRDAKRYASHINSSYFSFTDNAMKCSTDIRTTLCPCTMSRGELVQQMSWGKWGQCNTFLTSWDRNSLFSKFCEYMEILIVDCVLSHFPLMKGKEVVYIWKGSLLYWRPPSTEAIFFRLCNVHCSQSVHD